MIYTIFPNKDTYVTNKYMIGADRSLSNVGRAATLDFFKLNNENNKVKSWAILELSQGLPVAGETFQIIDSLGNIVVFEFFDGTSEVDNLGENVVGKDNIKIGLQGVVTEEELANLMSDIIDKVSSFTQTGPGGNQSLSLSSSFSGKTILLEQTREGESGDTIISQSENPVLEVKKNFSRTEYTNILIQFDLEEIKDKIVSLNESIFSSNLNFKAELELKDISLGHSKPYDYSVSVFPLTKPFDEGMGKDTVEFRDLGSSNFLSSSYDKSSGVFNTWGIKNYLVEGVDYVTQKNDVILMDSFDIKKGDEDIVFDITNYVLQFLDNQIENLGFTIRLHDDFLFDDSSYFVKRVGSRHLLNKKFIPRINLKLTDDSFYLPKNNKDISRYFNSQQDFYLYNKQNSMLRDIPSPTGFLPNHFSASLSFGDFELVKKGLGEEINKYTNLFGQEMNGIYKFSVNDLEVSRFNQHLSQSLETSNSIDFKLDWFWYNENDANPKRIIKSENVKISLFENDDMSSKNILSKTTVNNVDLIGDSTIQSISVFFIDTKKQYVTNRKPVKIKCENLGNVHIRVIDTYDDTILINYDSLRNSTKLFFNGIDYDYNFFVPNTFKGKILRFEFVIIDEITQTIKVIKDKASIKVV